MNKRKESKIYVLKKILKTSWKKEIFNEIQANMIYVYVGLNGKEQ